jgi:hypothetical protein
MSGVTHRGIAGASNYRVAKACLIDNNQRNTLEACH